MDTKDKLKIGYAGNLPYYDPDSSYKNGFRSLKKALMDYRYYGVNDPVGKSPYYFFKALQELKKRMPNPDIEVNLWGAIDDRIQHLAEKMGIDDLVKITGKLPRNESFEKLKEQDLLLLTVARGKNGNPPFSIPGKTFDYFELGMPILALVEESQCARAIRSSGLGIVINPTESDVVAVKIEALMKDKSEIKNLVADQEYLKRFHFSKLAEQYSQTIEDLINE